MKWITLKDERPNCRKNVQNLMHRNAHRRQNIIKNHMLKYTQKKQMHMHKNIEFNKKKSSQKRVLENNFAKDLLKKIWKKKMLEEVPMLHTLL